ncbi:MAG: TrmB family transcriptional regulator [Methanobacteriota archaeon]|nr:MAG: TrmB family transcriptional regulator [Euryarchaeota archaeon]
MEDLVEKLQKVGLTEYEAKAYLSLLSDNVNSASKLSEKSGVPRTKIYAVLESLKEKRWIRVYSGAPLLFQATKPDEVIGRIRDNFGDFLESIQKTLNTEATEMRDKFVIMKSDVGLSSLKEEVGKAKTVWISNATEELMKKLDGAFRDDAEVRVLMYPGERAPKNENFVVKEAEVKIVSIIKNKEVPSVSVILEEDRTFTVRKDPVSDKYRVDEMLYDECSQCFMEWYNLGWNADEEAS